MKMPLRRPWAMVVVSSLLVASFIAPLLLFLRVPAVGIFLSHEKKLFDREGIGIVKNLSLGHTSNAMQLNAIEQKVGEGVLEPKGVIYKDGDSMVVRNTYSENVTASGVANGGEHHGDPSSTTDGGRENHEDPSSITDGGREDQQNHMSVSSDAREDKQQGTSDRIASAETEGSFPYRLSTTTLKISEMGDQILMARAYLQFSSSNSNSHLVRDLKFWIKELERVLGRASMDSDLYMGDLQKMKAMEVILSKARKAYPDCSAQASKLRAQLNNSEEQLRAQQNQTSYLLHLTARTFPKGLHCLCMRLTTDYFALQPEERVFPNSQNVNKTDLYHYAIFSDNVLACAVVVNSTISTSMEPEKIVFHVVTDSFNYPAMMMWFLLNPPEKATMHIQSLDDLGFLPVGFSSMFVQSAKVDPRYTSPLNHLRFYLPEVFPSLNKTLLLDHDVVVQRDLRKLWSVDMKGKVNGAVKMCKGSESSHKLEMFVNFADPVIAKTFNAKACPWAFGMNIFDLHEWRRRDLTGTYHKWRQIGKGRHLWKAGSLPLGQLVFYNHTMILDRRWHLSGLGCDSNVGKAEIERAAVVHYDGNLKPWLDIATTKHRRYWTKFLDYNNPYLRRCNIHE